MTRITHLEDALYADTKGYIRDQWLEKLVHAELRLSEQLRSPQPTDAFKALEQCLAACLSARETIAVLWQRYHFSTEQKTDLQRST
ncbi:EscE/YscE/SsaE family type III secretion system needle protein co-chaperone [Pseudomonas zeae]|uniref:EscE/YscE/SsaE family type III secretion system needle protein co-chaperone n=1 Tax=Pseudomonas zeae TaxID=2745510 RepID=UPI0039E0CF3A